MRSYRQHCGMENHFNGSGNAPFRDSTIRAKLGVICKCHTRKV
jgi:hypothetical protein